MPLRKSLSSRHGQTVCLLCSLAVVALVGIIGMYTIGFNGSTWRGKHTGGQRNRPPNPYVLSGLASASNSILADDSRQSARAGLEEYLQTVHRDIHNEDLQTYCAQANFNEAFVASAEQRYKNITNGGLEPVFVAANLYNSEKILPNMAAQLLALADTLGRTQLFISIYENGSKDKTKEILKRFNETLNALGIAHRITSDDASKPAHIHRIEYLAKLRNFALDPLYSSSTTFGRVVYLNDMFFCLTDLLELVFQSQVHSAHLTCAEDFELRHGSLAFYDTWVARDILGHAFKKQPFNIADDGAAKAAQTRSRPFQVQCCWNGIAVIDAQVFRGKNALRFRRSAADECSASECSLLCNDMWATGYKRAVVVPRVKLSYDIVTRDLLREPYNYPRDAPFSDSQPKQIAFRPGPKTVYCHPLNGKGDRNPDGPASFISL
ncbi:hypothetical protein GGH94_002306 [Coemansia aciculifera]|uniref:Glycosyltransferase family 69 protein n=1 Tax=Coemansia aciculifera TaxID=417176 RepID=A0A9W8M660_9FUNG|nr:hypothetical protein GGH94_002306 [Coemansia aciculifera]